MIYADHAATTRLSERAREAMTPWLSLEYGNPSTLYSIARKPRKAIAEARTEIARIIGASSNEVYFTSGGTESDNWAIKSIAFQYIGQKKRIITSSIEHHAVLHPCAWLETLGFDVIYLPVDRQGIVQADDLRNAITDDTILVSIMMANNEIGTVEPIQKLAQIAHDHGALFHTDAVQAVGHIPIDVKTLGIDLLSASAHKFNGPKGIGFLYVRDGICLSPLMHGGGQENGSRSGTENVASIVGMAAALAENAEALERNGVYLEDLRNQLITGLEAEKLCFLVNGAEKHVPGSLSLSFQHAEGERLLHRLDLMGIAIATGSACNSKDTVLSHVVEAIGVPEEYAMGTVRITLGMDNTVDDVEKIVAALVKVLAPH